MSPFDLTSAGLAQPWRLWTCHLLHYGPGHALLNLAALAVPLAMAPGRWRRLALALVLLAPVLGLILLPGLPAGGSYRGASGLVCAAWALTGLHLAGSPGHRAEGVLLLAVLGAKLLVEAVWGLAVMPGGADWASLPAAHRWGALLGLLSLPLGQLLRRFPAISN